MSIILLENLETLEISEIKSNFNDNNVVGKIYVHGLGLLDKQEISREMLDEFLPRKDEFKKFVLSQKQININNRNELIKEYQRKKYQDRSIPESSLEPTETIYGYKLSNMVPHS